MRNFKLLTVWFLAVATLVGCDVPKKPDFSLSQKVEAPLLFEKTFQLIGGGEGAPEALLDTTKGGYDSLFTIVDGGANDGFITISKTQDFDFGDLNDAIPAIDADPAEFSSQVGELELGSFSSGSGSLGTASFEALTGLNPNVVPAGTLFPAGSTVSPVNIAVGENTDFFVSATIKQGAIELAVTNNLGFDISAIDVVLKSASTAIGTTTLANVNNGATSADQISFSEGDVLESLNVDISVSWNTQNTQTEPGELVVENINGVGLIASQVEAAVEPQDFSTSSTTTFDSTEFKFTALDHYVELESGEINIEPILNGLDLDVESLIISFPQILEGPDYNDGDSLVISYTGNDKIQRSSASIAQNIDLSGYRIYALNNKITYNIVALTENTQEAAVGDQTRIITENDAIASSVEISNLKIKEARGAIAAQTVLLGDDDASNGEDVVDLYNETEVSLTEIEELEDLSSQIDGIEFTQASLNINYVSNITVPTTIYAAILGVNGDGEELYLTGNSNTEREVTALDSVSGIQANGTELSPDKLVKFSLNPSPDGSTITSGISFDETNTNVNDFLNNLPVAIRFVGKSVINESGEAATIATPLEFDPTFVVDLPLALQTTTAATFSDTMEVDVFENFPKEGDERQLKEAELVIKYQNGLPLAFALDLAFVDEVFEVKANAPEIGEEPYELAAGTVDSDSRFVVLPSDDELVVALTESQLKDLNSVTSIILNATLNTTDDTEVKLRATDSITLSVSLRIKLETEVNID